MKKSLFLFLFLMLLLAACNSCNREMATNVLSIDRELVFEPEMFFDKNHQQWFRLKVYLPIGRATDDDKGQRDPFVLWFNGSNHMAKGANIQVDGKYPNHYRFDVILAPDERMDIVLQYGIYHNGNADRKGWKFADLDNWDNPYIVRYQPTNKTADVAKFIGFSFFNGSYGMLPGDVLNTPLNSRLTIEGERRVDQPLKFRFSDLTVAGLIGFKTYVIDYGDGRSVETTSSELTHSYDGFGTYFVTHTTVDKYGMKTIGKTQEVVIAK